MSIGRRYIYFLTLFFFLQLFYAPPGVQSTFASGEVLYTDGLLAVVEDRPITISMIFRRTAPLEMKLAQRLSPQEYNRRVEQLRASALEEMVNRKLVYAQFQEQQRRNERLAAHFQGRVEEVVRQEAGGDLDKFGEELRRQGMSLEDFREQVRQQMAIQHVMDEEVRRAVEISEKEVRQYYQENQDHFVEPEEVKIRRLLISSRQLESRLPFQQRFEEAFRRLQRGEDFELIGLALASRTDFLNSRWMEMTELPESLAREARTLPAEQVSSPINTREGVYFIYIEDKRGDRVMDFSEVRNSIERMLRRQRIMRRRDEFMQELRGKFHVRIFE